MSYYKPRYGLTHDEVKNLARTYYKHNLKESDFRDFDSFSKWAAESGRQQYAQLSKRDGIKPRVPVYLVIVIQRPDSRILHGLRNHGDHQFCGGSKFLLDIG